MCGIAGEVCFTGNADVAAVERMAAVLAPRGPEVLLKAYDRWGEAFVEHLHGMFALAIVERDSGDVVLVRDRLGIKPLYIAPTRSGVRFASTLPALLAAGGVGSSTCHSPRSMIRGTQSSGNRRLSPPAVRKSMPSSATSSSRTRLSSRRSHARSAATASR
jgi:asparagine synthase (glutamine-hydrolysing)